MRLWHLLSYVLRGGPRPASATLPEHHQNCPGDSDSPVPRVAHGKAGPSRGREAAEGSLPPAGLDAVISRLRVWFGMDSIPPEGCSEAPGGQENRVGAQRVGPARPRAK